MEDADSTLSQYRGAAILRQEDAFANNALEFHKTDDNIFSFVRRSEQTCYMVILNLGEDAVTQDLQLDDTHSASVVLTNKNGLQDQMLDLRRVSLQPGDYFVVKLLNDNHKIEL